MPPRMTGGSGEEGVITDQDTAPSSAVGLGKGTGNATDFAEVGNLPPDELRKLKELMGAPDSKSKENLHGLLLALNRHNLPTTDLKRALDRLQQVQRNKQGVDVRQTLNEAIKHMRSAEKSLAGAYELHAQQIADGTLSDAHQSDTGGGDVPAGYQNMTPLPKIPRFSVKTANTTPLWALGKRIAWWWSTVGPLVVMTVSLRKRPVCPGSGTFTSPGNTSLIAPRLAARW